MGKIILSTNPLYSDYLEAARQRVGKGSDLLPDSVIDSISYLQLVEDQLILLCPDLFTITRDENGLVTSAVVVDMNKASAIYNYILLRTTAKLLLNPTYAPVVRVAEFGESVQYAETELENRLELINNEIDELGPEICKELDPIYNLMGAIQISEIKSSYD